MVKVLQLNFLILTTEIINSCKRPGIESDLDKSADSEGNCFNSKSAIVKEGKLQVGGRKDGEIII